MYNLTLIQCTVKTSRSFIVHRFLNPSRCLAEKFLDDVWDGSAQTEAINFAERKTSSYRNHHGQEEAYIKPNSIKRNKQLLKSHM